VIGSLVGVQGALLTWYASAGRADLPWRRVRDPYYTLVSEVMLQQTQVERVVPKFESFVRRFPDVRALARAGVADVVREWKGLGYNSRAVRLRRIAEEVVARFDGVMPRDPEALRSLPGVGPYSVAALRAFAYDEDDAACDVNTRRVVQRLRLGIEFPARATAAQLDGLARDLVPAGYGHDWNSAVMDLGASICTARAPKCLLCPVRAACAAAPIDAVKLEALRRKYARNPSPQGAMKFERTTRYARGRIVDRLRQLPPGQTISLLDLHRDLRERLAERDVDEMRVLVDGLVRDGIARRTGDAVALAE